MPTTTSATLRGTSSVLESLGSIGPRLATLTPETMTADERQDVLAAIERTSGALTAARGRLLAAAERAGDWRTARDASAAAWHGRTSRVGEAHARAQVRQARTMERLPAVARAVAGGDVTTAHLDALARVAEQASEPAREALAAPDVQDELVSMAARQDPQTFAKAVRRRLAEWEPDEMDRSYAAQHAQRHLVLSTTPMGLRLQGQMDPVAGQVVRQALEALSPRPAVGDDRSPEQRRADALEAMAQAVLKDPGTTSGSAVRPHVSLVMTDESLAAHRQLEAERAGGSGGASAGEARVHAPGEGAGEQDAGGRAEPSLPFSPATFEDGAPVSPRAVARVLCDCEVTRVALDAQSMPVDVGRTKRVYDGHLRRAVIARDGTCSWPGCTQHARWCEIHHITWWSRGGASSLENAVLLCCFHHHRVHELDLRITRHTLAPGQVPGNGVARVRYEFRRRDGRIFVAGASDTDESIRFEPRLVGAPLPSGPPPVEASGRPPSKPSGQPPGDVSGQPSSERPPGERPSSEPRGRPPSGRPSTETSGRPPSERPLIAGRRMPAAPAPTRSMPGGPSGPGRREDVHLRGPTLFG